MTVAKIVELLGDGGDIVNYTCLNTDAIAKGAVLALTDPKTISGSSSAHAPGVAPAGIAAEEKEANDGATTIGVYTNVIADITSDTGVITVGHPVCISGADIVARHTSGARLDWVLGRALETSDGSSEVILVKVNT